MGRKLKTRVPAIQMNYFLKCRTMMSCAEEKRSAGRRWHKTIGMTTDSKVVLGEQLSPVDRVCIPDLHTEGSLVKCHEMPRSVVIDTSKINVRRNRRMTRKLESRSNDQQDGSSTPKAYLNQLYPTSRQRKNLHKCPSNLFPTNLWKFKNHVAREDYVDRLEDI